VRQGNPIIFMDERSAELTKYAANSFLATKITFMNEIANLCEKLGADVDSVRKGVGTDSRIGKRFLFPGIGYGGSCFPKDVQALVKSSTEVEYDFKILKAVMDINEKQKLHLIPKIKKYFKNNVKGKHFALWGLAFKPNTDDIREAPALYLIDALLNEGATLSVFDPEQETGFLMDAIRGLTRELGPDVPVLGFAAAPWTLACYMIEGHGKDGFPAAKTMLYSDPELFRSLLNRIARATARYLRAQIAAGASAVQLFDTWVGELTLEQYREFALPATQLLIEEIGAGDTPVILYAKASSHLLAAAAESGANVLSVDWRMDLAAVRELVGPRIALQGNVDPCVLLGPEKAVRRAAFAAIEHTGGIGHILNLGHGILQQTPVENARAFVQAGQSAAVADVRVEGAR